MLFRYQLDELYKRVKQRLERTDSKVDRATEMHKTRCVLRMKEFILGLPISSPSPIPRRAHVRRLGLSAGQCSPRHSRSGGGWWFSGVRHVFFTGFLYPPTTASRRWKAARH